MDPRKRFLWLALATAMAAPEGKAHARGRAYSVAEVGPPPHKQARRRERRGQELVPVASPCGRHVVSVASGAIFVDGRRVHPRRGTVEVLGPPRWRRDGRAVAWIERHRGETRLVVLPDLEQPLAWGLPAHSQGEQVFWAAANRVVVGPSLLTPRAVASWIP